MPENRIGVIGISTLDGPVGPNGHHLRWSFPRELGFPAKGFRIFRRPGGMKPKARLSFSALPLNVDLPDDLRIDGVNIIAHPAGRRVRCQQSGTNNRVLVVTPNAGAQVEFVFTQPIATLQVELRGSGSSTARAFRDNQLLVSQAVGNQVSDLSCAGINRLLIDLGARQVGSISYTTEADVCSDSSWTLIKTLPLPENATTALDRFENGLKNYYAATPNAARQRYRNGADEIIQWLARMQSPTSQFFADPNAAPHLLKIRSASGKPESATYIQSVFLLAALDPNVARLISLYWVDAFDAPAQGPIKPPEKDGIYDYKVEGSWDDGDGRCGLLLNLGRPPAPLPALKPDVEGEQLEGLHWIKAEPRGRVGLRWPKPLVATTPQARAVQPVLYELTRIAGSKRQKIPEPVLVDSQSWKQSKPVLHLDRDLPLGEYAYEVRPIDLFGQLGSAIKSPRIKVEDLEAPPPPVRTEVQISQIADTASLRLQFEFGATQHEQAPDVKRFRIYWRADTLLARTQVQVAVTSTDDAENLFQHTVRLTRSNQTQIPVSELKTFVGDVLTNVIAGADPPLPANSRRRFRIAAVKDSGAVVIEATPNEMVNGTYELIRDPHNRSTWTRLQQIVSWREPITGILRAVDDGLAARVVDKQVIAAAPNPFASIPAEQRGRQFPDVPALPDVVEIEIDRLLTEPDIFSGGSVTLSTGSSRNIIYVVSNAAAGRTRIALPAGTDVDAGDTITIAPSSALGQKVRRLTISGAVDAARLLTPGGEISFEDEDATFVMRVISNAVNQAGAFELLVKAETHADITRLKVNVSRLRYYAPYALEIPVALAAGSNAPISLPLSPTAGYRDGFIAVSAIDARNNEGQLGTAAQFSVIRPRSATPPSKPYPCGMDVTALAGYASPPDRAGRATICLAWDPPAGEGLRYEVARALDSGIISAHLRNWQSGKTGPTLEPHLTAGQLLTGNLAGVSFDSERGLIHATFEPANTTTDAEIFRNGRLERNGLHFQITLAKSNGAKVDLLFRGPGEPLPTSGAATLEAPPDYTAAKESVDALHALAQQAGDAFGMATGVPIAATTFLDEVNGVGRSRFFYRVRSVDAAENRSDWSPISAPFHQVDTSTPATPAALRATSGIRSTELRWLLDRSVDHYLIHRSLAATDVAPVFVPQPLATIESVSDPAAPLDVVFPDAQLDALSNGDTYCYRVTAVRTVKTGPQDSDRIVVASVPSAVVRAVPVDPEPPPGPQDLVAARTAGAAVRLTWSTTRQLTFSVRRRLVTATTWATVIDWRDGGEPSNSGWSYNVVDPSPVAESVVYQVVVRNHAGRTALSNETNPV